MVEVTESDAPNAGCSRHIAHHVEPPDWVSDQLLAETRQVFSHAYAREIDDAEAFAILANVRRLAEVLWKAQQTGAKP